MKETMPPAPDYLFIDVVLLAYRLGRVRHEEQKLALLAAARAAQDSISFLTALENFGVGRRTDLYRFAGEILAAPDYFRAQYPGVVGLRREGETPEPFLKSQLPIFYSEAVLTYKQYKLFCDAYWWFVRNHEPSYYDPKKGRVIGTYATEPQDNASTVARFEDYLYRLVNHRAQRIRARFSGFPVDILMAIYRRTFPF